MKKGVHAYNGVSLRILLRLVWISPEKGSMVMAKMFWKLFIKNDIFVLKHINNIKNSPWITNALIIFKPKPIHAVASTNKGEWTGSIRTKRSIDCRQIDNDKARRKTPLKKAPMQMGRHTMSLCDLEFHTDEFGTVEGISETRSLKKEVSKTCDLNVHTPPNSHVGHVLGAVYSIHGGQASAWVRTQRVDVRMLQWTRWHCISEMNMILMKDRLTSGTYYATTSLKDFKSIKLDSANTFLLWKFYLHSNNETLRDNHMGY